MAEKPKAAMSKTTKAKGDRVDRCEPRRRRTATGKVNLNTAEFSALEDLPGIGPATAKAIVEGRPWKSVDELDKIKGLGKNRIAALRTW